MSESKMEQEGMRPTDELGRDMELASWLEAVDPASVDSNYWFRFQSWVLKNAAPELARRRLMAELTMGDVMTSWARTVIPTAVLAAAVAALILFRAEPASLPVASVDLEELLVAEVEGLTIPATLEIEETGTTTFVEGF